nr:MAG TPA: hypothetical protein [Caudoviricetes sp.]
MENTTTDVNTSQNVADVSSTSDSSTDNLDFQNGFWEESEQSEGESKTDETQEKEEKPEEELEGKTEEKPEFPKAEERTAQLNNEIRGLVARRNELQQEVSQYEGIAKLQQQINENRVTPEQLEAMGLDPQDAAVQSLLYNQEIDKHQAELNQVQADIADLQYNIALDRVELLKDYPVFDEKSPEYDANFTDKATQLYMQAANLQLNEEGAPVSADMKLYEFMSALADVRAEGIKIGSQKISKTKQSAAVMNTGGMSTSSDDDENTFVENFFN